MTTVSRDADDTRWEGALTNRQNGYQNSRFDRTQFHEIPANPQILNTPEATHNPKVTLTKLATHRVLLQRVPNALISGF